jgi:hypothetical protein
MHAASLTEEERLIILIMQRMRLCGYVAHKEVIQMLQVETHSGKVKLRTWEVTLG